MSGATPELAAPFPWSGGKSRVAGAVWERLGWDVSSYVEPFFGSGAVLLGRPRWSPERGWTETVNDLDGFVANAFRALRADPAAVAEWADWPVNENDLHARHSWLAERRASLSARLEGDPDYCDPKIAGWWLCGIACWIGGGFCSGDGPWVQQNTGVPEAPDWKLVHLGSAGQGVHRKLVHLGDAGRGENGLAEWFGALSARLRRVRVLCGDWSRAVTDAAMMERAGNSIAVFLDPPYGEDAERFNGLYARDSTSVAREVRDWCVANGSRHNLRIALCGYRGEGHEVLEGAGWSRFDWTASGGYSGQGNGENKNREREAIWFSPGCPAARQRRLA